MWKKNPIIQSYNDKEQNCNSNNNNDNFAHNIIN